MRRDPSGVQPSPRAARNTSEVPQHLLVGIWWSKVWLRRNVAPDDFAADFCSDELRCSWLAVVDSGRLDLSMLTTVVITIFGPDRSGLVEAVAARAAAHGGNWLESRLLHLGGHFAGIVRLEVDDTELGGLLAALRETEDLNLHLAVHDAKEAPSEATPRGSRVALEVVGHDRPGIVRAISRALAERGINVEELATERSSAPMSGELIFQARATVTLPTGLDAATVRGDLEKIASDLMVDVRFTAPPQA